MDYRELDGGVYDNPDITIRQALDEIVTDLKEPTHRSELEGSIHTDDELIPIDYDGLMEKAEQAAKEHLEERIRNEVPEAMESKVIADFKAKTEELFHGINGQTQEDIELNVYAYLQSKIDEYGMDIQLVDMAVSGTVNASFYVFPSFKFSVILNLAKDNLYTFVYNYFQTLERK